MEALEVLKQISLGDVGFAGLVTLAIYLILTGRLVPKSTVEDIRNDRDTALANQRAVSQEWKEAFQTSEAARSEQGAQISLLVEYAKTSDHLIRAIQEQRERNRESESV